MCFILVFVEAFHNQHMQTVSYWKHRVCHEHQIVPVLVLAQTFLLVAFTAAELPQLSGLQKLLWEKRGSQPAAL